MQRRNHILSDFDLTVSQIMFALRFGKILHKKYEEISHSATNVVSLYLDIISMF